MSASTKKKLRKEQAAVEMTEKQLKEQKEAKKLKLSSILFLSVMVVVLIVGLTVMVIRGVNASGIVQKNTVALTVGDHEIDNVTMNYYYTDTVSSSYDEWKSMYGEYTAAYLSMMQLDLTKPLDEQTYFEGEITWADYFMDLAKERAIADCAVYDLAVTAGHELDAREQLNLESAVSYMDLYAMANNYSDVDDYMVAVYGPGASRDSYYAYKEVSALASSYYNAYSDTLTYTAEEISAHEAGNELNYNSYTYASYYLGYNKYLEEGTTDPSTEQIEAAAVQAKADATALLNATTVEELDAAIAALPVNAESSTAASTKYNDTLYTSVNSVIRDWLSNPSRKEAQIAMIANDVTSTDDAGVETTTTHGYYVVLFLGSSENKDPMANVRHLLVKYADETEEAKAEAKATAEGYLKTWKEGEATEESFIELVQKYSMDSSADNGGLFEDIYPGASYVPNFLNWSIDPARKVGDVDVIDSEYGYHVMYYVGDDELSYRDYMITNELRELDLEAWYNAALDSAVVTEGDVSHVKTGLVLGS